MRKWRRNGMGKRGALWKWLGAFCAPLVCQAMQMASVTDFGAIPNDAMDDAPAFQAALNRIMEAGGGFLRIPPGDYMLSRRLTVKAPVRPNPSANICLALAGAGAGPTRLVGGDPDGLLLIQTTRNGMNVTIRDISLLTTVMTRGPALAIVNPELGVRAERGVLVERLAIAGIHDRVCFETGISLRGQWRPMVRDVKIEGAQDASLADDSVLFAMRAGVDISGFYGGVISSCVVRRAHTAYRWVTDGTGEGGLVLNSEVAACRVGVEFYTPGQEPAAHVTDCKIEARDVGVIMDRRRLVVVRDNVIEPLAKAGAYPFTDVEIRDCWVTAISHNRFEGEAANRTHVLVDGHGMDRPHVPAIRTRTVQIHDNTFRLDPESAVRCRGSKIFGVFMERNGP